MTRKFTIFYPLVYSSLFYFNLKEAGKSKISRPPYHFYGISPPDRSAQGFPPSSSEVNSAFRCSSIFSAILDEDFVDLVVRTLK